MAVLAYMIMPAYREPLVSRRCRCKPLTDFAHNLHSNHPTAARACWAQARCVRPGYRAGPQTEHSTGHCASMALMANHPSKWTGEQSTGRQNVGHRDADGERRAKTAGSNIPNRRPAFRGKGIIAHHQAASWRDTQSDTVTLAMPHHSQAHISLREQKQSFHAK